MSFSGKTKEELSRIRIKTPAQKLSQLAGLTHTCGALYVGRGRGVTYASETLAVGKQILSLATTLYALDTTIELSERERRRPLTVVTLKGDDAQRLLLDTGLLCQADSVLSLGEQAPEALLSDDDARRAFLRGAFLGSGSCADPYRGYHLEIVAHTLPFAEQLVALIRAYGPEAKRMRRKERQVVYLKSDDVAGFLALIGASSAALAFENVRTEKDFRNYVNRANNCDTANIGKTVNASALQRQAIALIEDTVGLLTLPAPLYEAALLRMNHPNATLSELAEMAEIGKSGMNHRFERLMHIARELRDE